MSPPDTRNESGGAFQQLRDVPRIDVRRYDRRPMVLVVDDHPDTCIALVKLLRRSGVTADFVTSGLDALGFLNRRPPKLVVLDVMMPDMNVIDVLRAIRGEMRFNDVSVMMYSADSSSGRMQQALNEGAQSYVVKGSIGWDELVSEVKRYV